MTKHKFIFAVLPAIILAAGIVPAGFATYTIAARAQNGEAEANIDADGKLFLMEGIAIDSIVPYSYGAYHYIDPDGNTTDRGGIRFVFSIDPSKLDSDQKKENSQGGYSFRLDGSLECSQNAFVRDAQTKYIYYDSAHLENSAVNAQHYSDKRLDFYLDFVTNTKTQTSMFKLDFLFSSNLILDHRDDLPSYSFVLSVRGMESQ